jgi:hypothetical protein
MAPRKQPVIQQTLWRCNNGHLTTPDGYVFSGCESLQLANLMRLCYADIVQAARKEHGHLRSLLIFAM